MTVWFSNVQLTSAQGGSIHFIWTSKGIQLSVKIPRDEKLGGTKVHEFILSRNHARLIIEAFQSLDDAGFGSFTLRGTKVNLRVKQGRIIWIICKNQFWMQNISARNFVYALADYYGIATGIPTD